MHFEKRSPIIQFTHAVGYCNAQNCLLFSSNILLATGMRVTPDNHGTESGVTSG